MNRFYACLIVPAALVAAVSLPASAAAPSLTPDQQLVAGLEEARSAARATLKGKPELGKLAEGMRRARRAAPHAVGALESPAMQAALRASGHKQLRRLIALTSAALDSFGVPLEKDFPAFAVSRNFAYLPEFENYSGLSATVGDDVSEVVIGAADRQTANAGERGGAVTSAGLPITLHEPGGHLRSDRQLHVGPVRARVGPDHLPPASGHAARSDLHDRLRPEAPEGHEAAREVPVAGRRPLLRGLHDPLGPPWRGITPPSEPQRPASAGLCGLAGLCDHSSGFVPNLADFWRRPRQLVHRRGRHATEQPRTGGQ